jgi:hypothetical protein
VSSVGNPPVQGRWMNYESALERALTTIVQHLTAEPLTPLWTASHYARAVTATQRIRQQWLSGSGDRSSLAELSALTAHLSPVCGTVVRSVIDTIEAWIQDLEEDQRALQE